jgi:hypothetical protein
MKEKLQKETKKWLDKIEKEIKNIAITEKLEQRQTEEIIKNMKAYISDCKHFMQIGDWVRAFEAITYAWGIFETCLRAGLIKKQN